ncbi:hypothetical protein ACFX2F_028615 [Malus domestica]
MSWGMGTLVELWMRSFMIPSIHAVVAEEPFSMAEIVVAAVVGFEGGVFSGGNKGKPENPQTAGVVVIWVDVVVD